MGHSRTLLCLSTLILSLSSFTIADDAVMTKLLAALSPTPSGWSANTSYCQWTNVNCSIDSRVTNISLFSQNLSGILPSNLGSLTELRVLSVQGNNFSGPLPSLAYLSSLEQLYLDNNYFSSIPDGFFQGLTSLQYLFLSENRKLAPWTFPTELTQSTSLVTLDAGSANLFGSLPDMSKMTSLKNLSLHNNHLTDSIPDSLTKLPDLQLLDLSNNNLTGSIPKFRSKVKLIATGNRLLPSPPGSQRLKAMIIALATLSVGIGVVIIVICRFKRKFLSNKIIYFWKKKSLNHQTVQTFPRNRGPLEIGRYSYSDIKKMTNSFTDKLGEGGNGCVFKGKLQDGCLVAVKVLKETRGNGEEFINEVTSISRTSHVNIVSLMGFCFEGSKKALIYEFMPNGSLEKFIYKESPSKADRRLEWETLYKIALGIARGLEYLHKGCNTRILHFDIKPHNILLDGNFCPKISDFGLAEICPREKSNISNFGARGTPGYIAPEVCFRNFGEVSHKSDVYSYGMMVFEMVGGRRKIDVEIDRTSETFFPHRIYKHLEQDEDLELEGLMNEEDHESARKMIIVSLYCIQTDPSNRPPMSKVVNMLEGSLESLQLPPMPYLSSPSRSLENSSTTMGSLHIDLPDLEKARGN